MKVELIEIKVLKNGKAMKSVYSIIDFTEIPLIVNGLLEENYLIRSIECLSDKRRRFCNCGHFSIIYQNGKGKCKNCY